MFVIHLLAHMPQPAFLTAPGDNSKFNRGCCFSLGFILNMFANDLTVIDMKSRKDLFVSLLMLGITLASNLAAGFLVGIVVAYVLKSERLNV